jgi:hypothetical protein
VASGELAYHVLDTLVAIDAINEDRMVPVESRVAHVPLLADDFDPFQAPTL